MITELIAILIWTVTFIIYCAKKNRDDNNKGKAGSPSPMGNTPDIAPTPRAVADSASNKPTASKDDVPQSPDGEQKPSNESAPPKPHDDNPAPKSAKDKTQSKKHVPPAIRKSREPICDVEVSARSARRSKLHFSGKPARRKEPLTDETQSSREKE